MWFAEQAVFGAAGLTNPVGGGGGVAYFAHVGGFVFGALTIRAAGDAAQAHPGHVVAEFAPYAASVADRT